MSLNSTDTPTAAHTSPTSQASAWRVWLDRHRGEGTALAIYVASRSLVWLSLWTASYVARTSMRDTYFRWDVQWYVKVVTEGYPSDSSSSNGIAFFPLFPRLLDVVARITSLDLVHSGLVLNAILGAVLAVVLWRFARRLTDDTAATRASLLFWFFPGSFVLTLGYSEAVMLIFAVLCLHALVDNRWLTAGVMAAIATASRPNALALVVACAVGAGVAVYRSREWRALVAPLLAPLGFIGYMLFVWRRTGDAVGWWHVQRDGWHEQFDFGWGLLQRARAFRHDLFGSPNEAIAIIGALVVVAMFVVLIRWRPPYSVIAYTATIIVLALGSATIGGRPRFILVAFPLFVALARVLRSNVFSTTVAMSGGALTLLTVMTAATFSVTP